MLIIITNYLVNEGELLHSLWRPLQEINSLSELTTTRHFRCYWTISGITRTHHTIAVGQNSGGRTYVGRKERREEKCRSCAQQVGLSHQERRPAAASCACYAPARACASLVPPAWHQPLSACLPACHSEEFKSRRGIWNCFLPSIPCLVVRRYFFSQSVGTFITVFKLE